MSRIKKKPIIYSSILIGIILITLLISHITGVATGSTWLGTLFANTFFLTVIIMLFDMAKSVRTPRVMTKYIVYFFPLLMSLLLVISNILLLVGAISSS